MKMEYCKRALREADSKGKSSNSSISSAWRMGVEDNESSDAGGWVPQTLRIMGDVVSRSHKRNVVNGGWLSSAGYLDACP